MLHTVQRAVGSPLSDSEGGQKYCCKVAKVMTSVKVKRKMAQVEVMLECA